MAVNLRRYCPTVVFCAPMESRLAKSLETLLTLSARLSLEPEPDLRFFDSSLAPQPTASCCSSCHLGGNEYVCIGGELCRCIIAPFD